MKILLTGAGGQVGRALIDTLAPHDLAAFDHAQLEITDRDLVMATVARERPDLIVNAAAWIVTDACEGDPDKADLVNGHAVHHVVEAADAVGARVLQISTDYVFDGTLGRPYVETDPPNPMSAYGRSKLIGEQATRPGDTIVRTSWVAGRHGANMVKTILRLAGEHETLQFVDDQHGHPTIAEDLAAMIRRLIDEELSGLYHVTNQGVVSWFDLAREVLVAAGLDPERVQPVATADLEPPRPAPRPPNSALENAALRAAGIEPLGDHREPLAQLVRDLTGQSRSAESAD